MRKFKLFVVLLTLFILATSLSFGQSQTNPYFSVISSSIFNDSGFSVYHDATKDVGIYKAYYVQSSSTAADSIISSAFRTTSGDESFSIHTVNVSGTINYYVYWGVFMGAGYGYDGYKWNQVLHMTTAGDTSYSISSAEWNAFFPSPFHKIKIVESGTQQNKYYINVMMWRTHN